MMNEYLRKACSDYVHVGHLPKSFIILPLLARTSEIEMIKIAYSEAYDLRS